MILEASTWRWLIVECVSFGRRSWIFTNKSIIAWYWLSESLQFLKQNSVKFQVEEALAIWFTLTVQPETLEEYGVLWLLLLVQTFPWELTSELHLEAIYSLAIRSRMSWWMSTRRVLKEIFVNFLLYMPHVPVTEPVVTLKAKMKHWRLIDFPVWLSLLLWKTRQ